MPHKLIVHGVEGDAKRTHPRLRTDAVGTVNPDVLGDNLVLLGKTEVFLEL